MRDVFRRIEILNKVQYNKMFNIGQHAHYVEDNKVPLFHFQFFLQLLKCVETRQLPKHCRDEKKKEKSS